MKIVSMDEVATEPVSGALFPEGAVTRQSILSGSDSRQLSFTLLSFAPGAKNAMHTHTGDQVVLVTQGRARVGTAHEERVVTARDVVFFPAGEPHWHAGDGNEPAAFLSITPQGTTTDVVIEDGLTRFAQTGIAQSAMCEYLRENK